tara:strand:+ start:1142 stop:1300 length:159 start_codon:yes stop_codon:yes gene_type:complete
MSVNRLRDFFAICPEPLEPMGSDRVQSNADTFDVEDLAHPRKQNGQSKDCPF